MAWKNYDNSDEDGKVSEWNAAALKMKRLDKEFHGVQEVNINPRAFNMEFGLPNYEVKFKRLENQHLEVESKLSESENNNEKQVAEDLRQKIKILLDKFVIYKQSKNKLNNKSKLKKDEMVYRVLDNLLYEYEKIIRRYIDDHGMDTSYAEDDEGL